MPTDPEVVEGLRNGHVARGIPDLDAENLLLDGVPAREAAFAALGDGVRDEFADNQLCVSVPADRRRRGQELLHRGAGRSAGTRPGQREHKVRWRLKRDPHRLFRTRRGRAENHPSPAGPGGCHTCRVSDDETFHIEMDSHSDDTLTVALAGELDMADADWVEATLAAAAAHHSRLTIDLSRLEFVDSTGLRTLLTLKQRAKILNIDLRFDKPSEAVSRVIDAAGLHSVLD